MDDNDLTGLEMLNLKIDEVAFSICLISISEIISNTKDRQEKGMALWFSSITICWMFFGGRQCFYLFDLHSKDGRGNMSVDGTAVLMKFETLSFLGSYI